MVIVPIESPFHLASRDIRFYNVTVKLHIGPRNDNYIFAVVLSCLVV